jgi:hypothetical protein
VNLEAFTQELIDDDSVSVAEIVDRVTARLVQQPDRGAGEAVDCLLTTEDARIASYVANYLALLPGLQDEKTRVADRLRLREDLAPALSALVPWISAGLLEQLVKEYVEGEDPEGPLVDVVFVIAMHHPELLRPYLDRIEDVDIRLGMMSGAPDEYVPGLVDKWLQEKKPGALDLLARMRTEAAARALLGLRTCVEMAGLLPDSVEPSGHRPAYLGSVVDRGESPHVLGGAATGELPLCPACERPAAHVLTLSVEDLPFSLTGAPSLYWYSCRCYASDSVTVRITPNGPVVLAGPHGVADPDAYVVPGERALALEPHPNQSGVSIDTAGGSSVHQVGGLPCWVTPAPHPHCPECGHAMRFLATIDSGPTPFGRMNFDGTLYGFWCDPCQVSTVEHQA